jgi:hypothetical protein
MVSFNLPAAHPVVATSASVPGNEGLMIYVIRNSDRTIKTFSERGDDFVLQPGETIETLPYSFVEFASRLRLSVDGVSGQTIIIPAGSSDIVLDVSCPGQSEVQLYINELLDTVLLTAGQGQLLLSAELPGTYFITPADKINYFSGGESILTIEVI